MVGRRWPLALLGMLMLLLTGCWSAHDIDRLAIVLAVGEDITPRGQYQVTAMIANPSKPGEEGGGAKGSWIMSAQGPTFFYAVRELATAIPRRLFWSHSETIVYGRRLAERGIRETLDITTRDAQPRRTLTLLVADGDLTKILDSKPVMEKGIAQELAGLVKERELHSHAAGGDLNQYLRDRAGGRTAPLVAMVKLKTDPGTGLGLAPQERITLSGTAVFWQDKAIGYFDETQSRGALWIRGKTKGGSVTIPCLDQPDQQVSLKLKPSISRIRAGVQGGKPWGEVSVRAEATVAEMHCLQPDLTPTDMDQLTQEFRAQVEGRVRAALTKARQLGVDPFGFGDAIYRADLAGWQTIAPRWPGIFSSMPIQVYVEAKLDGSGLTAGPTQEPK